ncbi:hypothetical protein WN51_14161 [Melipona quadrifasciata]|uniref:Uncharacterized protein n=1 Tax=Melipona quadrifasciata TaxID=166423 RepID=A0A0N0BG05_9HYME|nr:hypothetical protein WN51_14161 [Melipona quadrifasciata]
MDDEHIQTTEEELGRGPWYRDLERVPKYTHRGLWRSFECAIDTVHQMFKTVAAYDSSTTSFEHSTSNKPQVAARLASRSCQSATLKKAECGNTAKMRAPTSLAGSYTSICGKKSLPSAPPLSLSSDSETKRKSFSLSPPQLHPGSLNTLQLPQRKPVHGTKTDNFLAPSHDLTLTNIPPADFRCWSLTSAKQKEGKQRRIPTTRKNWTLQFNQNVVNFGCKANEDEYFLPLTRCTPRLGAQGAVSLSDAAADSTQLATPVGYRRRFLYPPPDTLHTE